MKAFGGLLKTVVVVKLLLAGSLCLTGCVWDPMCVIEGTMIETPFDAVAIESLLVGDVVYSRDERGDRVEGRVSGVHEGWSWGYVELAVEGVDEPIGMTESHVVASGDDWVSAGRLGVGDGVVALTSGGADAAVVEGLVKRGGLVRVYDLSVEGYENYFAGGLLVHNKTVVPDWPPDLSGEWYGRGSDGRAYMRINTGGRGVFVERSDRGVERVFKVVSVVSERVGRYRHRVELVLERDGGGAGNVALSGETGEMNTARVEGVVLSIEPGGLAMWCDAYRFESREANEERAERERLDREVWESMRGRVDK